MTTKWMVLLGLFLLLVPASAMAVPDPARCTCPPIVRVGPGGNCCFTVVVRNSANNPIPGANVVVDFGSCTPSFCPAQPPGLTIVGNTARMLTDAVGEARFCVCATLAAVPCTAAISADGVMLCVVPVDVCASPDETRLKVLVLLEENATTDLVHAVRARIEGSGGRVRAVLGYGGLVADVEPGSLIPVEGMPGVYGVYDAPLAAAPFSNAWTVAAVAAWNRLLGPPPPPDPERPGAPATDAYPAPDHPGNMPESPAVPDGRTDQGKSRSGCGSNNAGYYDTSLYLAGDIAVGIFYTTSGWNPVLETATYANLVYALDQFLVMEPYARLTFTYVPEVDILGNPLPKPSNERQYDNDLRTTWCTDWAYLIEVRNDGTWPNAFLNGPSMRLDLGWSPYYVVARHETGHIFGAGDQYCPFGPSPRYGYVAATHANACGSDGTGYFAGAGENLPDLMSGWDACYGYNDLISAYTAGQFGWYDHDGDGVLDVINTQPVIDGASVNHTPGNTPTYGGTAFERPLLDEDVSYGSVSINRVTGVQYRLDGLAWQDATAADGSFDSASEGFQFTTPPLPNGTHPLQIRATNTIGKTTVIPYLEQLVITGSAVTNTRPYGALSVTPARANVGTTVVATGSASRDAETPFALLQYSWRWGDGPPFSAYSSTPTASHVYSAPGTYLVEMRVRDALGLFHLVSRTVIAEPYDTAPVVSLRATPENRHFTTGPSYPVYLSVAGTTDGETPYASLSVRWDADDDGVWDGPWSTQKTNYVTLSGLNLKFPPSCVSALVYPKTDRRRVRVEVMDGAGNITSASRWIWVVPYNRRPTTPFFNNLTFVPSGSNFIATAHASDTNFSTTWDGLLEYRWDFEGDGIWDTRFDPGASITVASPASVRAEAQDRFQARVGMSNWWISLAEVGPMVVPSFMMAPIIFSMENAGDDQGQLLYRVSVRRSDNSQDSLYVSLNGQPPGSIVTGTLDLPLGETGSASVDVELTNPPPATSFYLVIEGDTDHNGIPAEPLATIELRSEAGTTTAAPEEAQIAFSLGQNRPNPFTRATTIKFALPHAAATNLIVLDVQGRRVRTLAEGRREAGPQSVNWDGRDDQGRTVPAGVYFYELQADQLSAKRKLVLVK